LKKIGLFFVGLVLVSLVACSPLVLPGGTVFSLSCGVNAHLPDDPTLDAIVAAGMEWVRLSVSWALVEVEQGLCFWDFVDDRVQAAQQRGLRILLSVSETPDWASDSGEKNAIPRNPEDWQAFMEQVVQRYPGVEYWGIWNEPNGGDGEFFSGSPAEFRDAILLPGAQGVLQGDPGAKIVAPGITIHTGWQDWMQEIFTPGVKELVDVVSVHLYVQGDADDLFWYVDYRDEFLDDILPLENVLLDLGLQEYPVWLEETGWNTWGPGAVSESQQADYFHQLLVGFLQRKCIEVIFPYEMIDDPEAPKGFGLLRADSSPKAAYGVFQDFFGR